MQILLIEDDEMLVKHITRALLSKGYGIQSTGLGEEGIGLSRLYDYDLIILDLNLPDIDGESVIKIMRKSNINTPIIIISSSVDIPSKVHALNMGADDYLTKPCHKDELVARIQSVMRRFHGYASSDLEIGELTVNVNSKVVKIHDEEVKLTVKEYQIMEILALRRGITLTKEMLLDHLYNGTLEVPEIKIIDVFICKLRKKIAKHTPRQYIATVWGRGYAIKEYPDGERPIAVLPCDSKTHSSDYQT